MGSHPKNCNSNELFPPEVSVGNRTNFISRRKCRCHAPMSTNLILGDRISEARTDSFFLLTESPGSSLTRFKTTGYEYEDKIQNYTSS